jgi:hypothetical protein
LAPKEYGPELTLDALDHLADAEAYPELTPAAVQLMRGSVQQDTASRRLRHIHAFREWLMPRLPQSGTFNMSHLMNYYAGLSEAQFGQFGTIRTAIQTSINTNAGFNPSDHIKIKRQAAGIFRKYPALPKYETMWDLRVLLNYFRDTPHPVKNLDFRLKANALIRASVAGRNVDIAHIHRKSIKWFDD